MTLNHPPAPLDLVNAIRFRAREAIGSADLGITTADSYLREFEACLDGACPSNILQGVTPRAWRRLMKRASRTLVYHGDGLQLGETFRKDANLPKDVELPPKTIAWTSVVVTTPTRDRDGDILETSGADLDPSSPHLFNHLPCEVVGRVVKQTAHTKKVLRALLSFMATEFAENVATMYEHGALRTSHGFLPTRWEPLEDGEGFRILEFKILEVSGVSIPSNPDAGPTAFSRNKLTHPLLKEWGRMKFRRRRKMEPVAIDVRGLPAAGTARTPARPAETQCTCSTTTERVLELERDVNVNAEPKATIETKGIHLGPADVRKITSALHHFKAIEHHDDAANAHVELARAAYQPLQDMLNQLDSDPEWHGYDDGKTDVPAGDNGKSLSGKKLGKETREKIHIALEHGESLATHKSATAHVKGLARHAACHLKAVLGDDKPNDGTNSARADDDGDMSYYGGDPKNLNPARRFERRCDAMFDEAIDALADDGGDALITLAATGSRAGRIIVGHQSRQAVSEAE